MGNCLCKPTIGPDDDVYELAVATTPSGAPTRSPGLSRPMSSAHPHVRARVTDKLVINMLSMIASYIDSEDESPVCLVELRNIANKEDGWIMVVQSLIDCIPLDDPFASSAISTMLDDCPIPMKESVLRVTHMYHVTPRRVASGGGMNRRVERNMCLFLGFIAEKLPGPNSVRVMTPDILGYLVALLKMRDDPILMVHALVALEKFAQTTENKLAIKDRLALEGTHPLLALEADWQESEDMSTRQIGLCAQWALDNLFVAENRVPSYEVESTQGVNAMLNMDDVTQYLKIASSGLEARCDSNSFESVRCTFQVDEGAWFYESTLVTGGVMQIGWSTKHSKFMNHDGYGIGDDVFSLAYDGCRRLVWYNAKAFPLPLTPRWGPGDTLGCFIDVGARECLFIHNGVTLPSRTELFISAQKGFFAAASFMAFQQCQFNFGSKPFKYPPCRSFRTFNDHGHLKDDQKKVVARSIYLQRQLRMYAEREDCCNVCFDLPANCMLEPCQHTGVCSVCTTQIRDCPYCRTPIENVRVVSAISQ